MIISNDMANGKTSNEGPARVRYRAGNRGQKRKRARLDRHLDAHPADGVAKAAIHKLLGVGSPNMPQKSQSRKGEMA